MRRMLCIFLAVIMLLVCWGCESREETGTTVNFYYRAKEPAYGAGDGVFYIEAREISYESSDYQKLIEEYLRGARMDACISPFPPGTTLVKLSTQPSSIAIELSPHMAFQSNADVIVCCACLCKTLFDISDMKTISFSIENREINGEPSITFYRDSFVNWEVFT